MNPAVYVPLPPSHSSANRVPPFQKLFEYQPKMVEYRLIDGDHEWRVWQDTIGDALEYMTSFVSQPQIMEP